MNLDLSIGGLLLGASGAVAAIFLKEAVQASVQRRVIAWQLFAYLIHWKSELARNAKLFSLYDVIKSRESIMRSAAAKSTQAFKEVHLAQSAEREEVRAKMKQVIHDLLTVDKVNNLGDELSKLTISEISIFSGDQRNMLAESRSFISDRDAAMLGRAAAMNVVQFRTSLLYLMYTMEGLLKSLPHAVEGRAQLVAGLVDHIIVHGERLLIALIRLERLVDAITAKSLFDLTFNSLRGR